MTRPTSLQETSRNVSRRSRAAWLRTALLSALSAGLVATFFLPLVTFRPDGVRYTFTPLQLLIGHLRLYDTVLTMPLAVRLAAVTAPLLAAAGLVLTLLRRAGAAAVCYLLNALAALGTLMAVNATASRFIAAGASTITMQFHTTLAVWLLTGLLAAVFAMWSCGGERLAQAVFGVFACMSAGSVLLITLYMFVVGTPAIAEIGIGAFLFGGEWNPGQSAYGIRNMILASFTGMLGAVALGVPIGVLTAVFLAELAPVQLARLIRPAVELLAGIPSVIYGFFGMMILVPAIRRLFPSSIGESLLAMMLILAIMVLPTIVSVSETALRAVPAAYKEASLALGATPVSTIFRVQLPAERSGVLAGVLLGVGRAVGETMAVIMVCGNIVNLPQLLGTVRPLTTGVVLEMNYASGLHRQALFSIGLVLFVFIMLVNLAFTVLSKKGVKIDGKE